MYVKSAMDVFRPEEDVLSVAEVESVATALGDFGPSLTIQSDGEEADINNIVRKFGITGQMPQGLRVPTYGDFTEVGDYRSAQEALIAARDSFMQLPAHVRARFENDPQAFLEFCTEEQDGKLVNIDEMRKLGLAVDEVKKDTAPVAADVPPKE